MYTFGVVVVVVSVAVESRRIVFVCSPALMLAIEWKYMECFVSSWAPRDRRSDDDWRTLHVALAAGRAHCFVNLCQFSQFLFIFSHFSSGSGGRLWTYMFSLLSLDSRRPVCKVICPLITLLSIVCSTICTFRWSRTLTFFASPFSSRSLFSNIYKHVDVKSEKNSQNKKKTD